MCKCWCLLLLVCLGCLLLLCCVGFFVVVVVNCYEGREGNWACVVKARRVGRFGVERVRGVLGCRVGLVKKGGEVGPGLDPGLETKEMGHRVWKEK